jgi:PAS domain S-box-containing protein
VSGVEPDQEHSLDLQEFQMRLEEAHETLRAIRYGEVDALVVRSADAEQVYTLQGADRIYRVLIEGISEGVLTLAPEGTVLYCNRRFAELVRAPLEQIMGAPVQRHVAAADRAAFEALLAEGLDGHGKAEISLGASPGGEEVRALISIDAVRSEGVVSCCTAIVTDVTELRCAQQELQRAHDELESRVAERTRELTATNEALQQEIALRRHLEEELRHKAAALTTADERKDRFLATLAHELRNPLAPILNAAQLLRHTGVQDEKRLRWAGEVVERQVRHLTRLVDDLLDVSRISRGKIGLQLEEVELAEVIAEAVETCRPKLDERGHVLTLDLPQQPLRVAADRLRLAQVLGNLLNNAAKYTGKGGHIRVSAEREGGELAVRVRDNGQGIAPELLPQVFELFAQGEDGFDRAHGGLGIGLSLVRSLVALHGGRVEAHSEGTGAGSEFVIRLPAPADPAAPAASG